MTHLPTDQKIRDLFHTLQRLANPVVPKGPTGLERLQARTLTLVNRARTAPLANDGYPAGTLGDGPRGNAELTSVEAAANRCFPGDDGEPVRTERDWVLEDAENAVGYLQDAVLALGALATRLDHADRLASPLSRSESGGAGQCLACGADVSGAANDRLRAGYCPACDVAWRRAGRPDRAAFRRERRATA